MHDGAVFVKSEGGVDTFGFSVAASAAPQTSSPDADAAPACI